MNRSSYFVSQLLHSIVRYCLALCLALCVSSLAIAEDNNRDTPDEPTAYTVTGKGSAFIFSHELLTLCQVACDRAKLRAFENAYRVCKKKEHKLNVAPIHGECFTESATLGCRGKYPLEFYCE